jgi:hypothetical protein
MQDPIGRKEMPSSNVGNGNPGFDIGGNMQPLTTRPQTTNL